MNIVLKELKLQFKNPIIGQPTRAIEEHYYGRRVVALVNGSEKQFYFTKDEMPFLANEVEIISSIENREI
ncbi:hypothetical protein [Metabacillus fastidiosus]|uniref:hypothetical protein n=1 Tax=Metabacillus fastidiosus TaxID=1458 RepID=UPI003D2C53AD